MISYIRNSTHTHSRSTSFDIANHVISVAAILRHKKRPAPKYWPCNVGLGLCGAYELLGLFQGWNMIHFLFPLNVLSIIRGNAQLFQVIAINSRTASPAQNGKHTVWVPSRFSDSLSLPACLKPFGHLFLTSPEPPPLFAR